MGRLKGWKAKAISKAAAAMTEVEEREKRRLRVALSILGVEEEKKVGILAKAGLVLGHTKRGMMEAIRRARSPEEVREFLPAEVRVSIKGVIEEAEEAARKEGIPLVEEMAKEVGIGMSQMMVEFILVLLALSLFSDVEAVVEERILKRLREEVIRAVEEAWAEEEEEKERGEGE